MEQLAISELSPKFYPPAYRSILLGTDVSPDSCCRFLDMFSGRSRSLKRRFQYVIKICVACLQGGGGGGGGSGGIPPQENVGFLIF